MARAALLLAGEASGDLYGGILVEALRKRFPDHALLAFGGPRMARAGARLVVDLVSEAVIGVTEALARLPRYLTIWRELDRVLREERPSPVVLIDYPGFNLRAARLAKGYGLTTIYYVPPKVWAWRAGRAKTLARVADLVVTIFPFEPPLYERHGGRAVYCGHPLVDVVDGQLAGRAPAAAEPGLRVALLPGSRRQEIERLLPRFALAALRIRERRPDARFVLPRAHTVERELLERHLAPARAAGVPIDVTDEPAVVAAAGCRAALVASGTVTLEVALAGVPMTIAYALSALSALCYRLLVRAPHVGLPNIVLERRACPELLQGAATPEALAAATLELLDDGPVRAAQVEALAEVRRRLGGPGAMGRILDAVTPLFAKGAA